MNKLDGQAYTITLDDDEMVHRIIERSTKIPTIGIKDPDELLARMDTLDPVAFFVDIDLGKGRTGLDLIPELRISRPYCPILVVTATIHLTNLPLALGAGADDFIRKPLNPDEIEARLRIRMLDMAQKAGRDVVNFGDLTVDFFRRVIKGQLGERSVSPIDIKILSILASSQGVLVTHEELKLRCWDQLKVTDNALHRKMHSIRELLRDVSGNVIIEAKYREGFCLKNTERQHLEVV